MRKITIITMIISLTLATISYALCWDPKNPQKDPDDGSWTTGGIDTAGYEGNPKEGHNDPGGRGDNCQDCMGDFAAWCAAEDAQ